MFGAHCLRWSRPRHSVAPVGDVATLRADAGGVVILEETPEGLLITVADWPPLADLRERPANIVEAVQRAVELNLTAGLSVWIKPLYLPRKFQ